MPARPIHPARYPKWFLALSHAQRRHIVAYFPSISLRKFRATRDHLHRLGVPCFRCEAIAVTLARKGFL